MSPSRPVANGAITLTVVNGIPTTTSNDVARHFGKRHDHVLRDIQSLLNELPESARPNFGEGSYTLPETGSQQHKHYRITRDGFTLLAMGFTGKKAIQFKLAYIDAFNQMEAELQPQAAPQMPETFFSSKRWLVSFQNGREVIQEVGLNARILNGYDDIPRLLADRGVMLSTALLVNIASACMQRLSGRLVR